MKHISEVKDVLESFIIHAKNLRHNIKEMLSDNGGEYDSQEIRKILKEHGISQKLTALYTLYSMAALNEKTELLLKWFEP